MEKVDYLQLESEVVNVLKTVYDPEIPVNIYDMGLIYELNVNEEGMVDIKMTLTAPNCPLIDDLVEEVNTKVSGVEGVKGVNINLVFDPPWDKDRMSDEAKLELGFL
ncbi:MAG: iron-sulfur cluster assembly protein [Bacteroidota bacterium]|nr:iron-sulfur cluster assembly protein [Bacteroidota bacterium]MDP4226735.1 iron-sulfur cluster assembly protein [Bacteroidota bacterium]MDP4273444.1 iron-sulfur cluster assembly protein [Bacteroidota bacterium]